MTNFKIRFPIVETQQLGGKFRSPLVGGLFDIHEVFVL